MPNLSQDGLHKNEREESNKRSGKLYALIFTCAAAAVIIFLLIVFNSQIDQSVYSIDYVVKAFPDVGCLNVDINIDISKLSRDRTIMLYKGLMTAEYISCTDDSGEEIPFSETPDLIGIGPISEDSKSLHFKYDAFIGESNEDEELLYGLPTYTQGCIFDDLIAFSGEYAILVPFLDPDSFDSIEKYVKSASFEFVVPDGLQPIIPYETPIEGQFSFSIDNPDWDFFNSVSKSAFCFGQFESYDYNGSFGDASVFVDKSVLNGLSQYSLDALTAFLYYYTDIFGEPLGNVPLVLLRNHPADNSIITAGAGSNGSAISINLRVADDFKALSNMVFHSFFDSKIKPRNLRYKGYDWIYRGLSEYYVGNSVEYLPEHIVDEYSVGSAMLPSERYLRYLYFSLKEPGFLALSPADEMSGMYIPQEEFYMGIKVPIIIDVINFSLSEKNGEYDGFLKALIREGKNSAPLDVEKLLKEICGGDYEVIKDYLSGRALVPNYRGFNIENMSHETILYMLDQDNERYSYFFNRQKVFYPYVPLFLLEEEAFMSEVEERGIHYNTDDIQNEVKNFSSVLHRLLLQYAMWAHVAGIDDVTRPNIYRELAQKDVLEKWSELCHAIGSEYRIEE